jgi:hypothetical protein
MCKRVTYLIFITSVFGLSVGQASGVYRAAYWDGQYWTSWADESVTVAIRDAFQGAGYEILDAGELKTWMNARIADGKASVVVFCRDVAPDTVIESMSPDCTLRKYLDAGGKIVWYSDIPVFYQGHLGGGTTWWGPDGPANILGIPGLDWTKDTGTQVTLTDDGATWGLTETWTSNRWAPADDTFTILATDATGNAAAWMKHFVPGDTSRGFVRIWDTEVTANYRPTFEDLLHVAEYGLGGSPFARGPNPPDGSQYELLWANLSWYAGDFAVSHDVYLGEDFDDVNEATRDSDVFRGNTTDEWLLIGVPEHPYPTGLTAGTTYYWRVDEVNDANVASPWKGPVWSFWLPPKTAWDPDPPDGAKFVDRNVELSWTPGWNAVRRYVYFGDDFDTVKNAAGGRPQGLTTYNPGTLEFDNTYYWRVDEMDNMSERYRGAVWHFTTTRAGGGLKGEYFNNTTVSGLPELTRIDSGIDFDWADGQSPDPSINSDYFSVRWTGELEAAFSEPYTFYVTTDDGARLWLDGQEIISAWWPQEPTQYQSKTIQLTAGQRYSIRMEWYEDAVGAVAKLSWQSLRTPKQIIPAGALSPPVRASRPMPANGATDVKHTPTLTWTAGDKAVQHDVYFGADPIAVADADTTTPVIYRGRYDPCSYTPAEAPLEWAKTYYWRVDEVNDLVPDSPWKGGVWSFTTADFVIVDDFEDYSDFSPDQIFQAWIDGFGYDEPFPGHPGNGTGSTVGNVERPFTEQIVVHSGLQSMPFAYTNDGSTGKALYSEAERRWPTPQDWTVNGVKGLSLWFKGDAANSAEPLYVAVQDNSGTMKVVTHENPNAVLLSSWQEWNIDLREFAGADVNLTGVEKMYIGVGDKVDPKSGGTGGLYFDDIRLYKPRCVASLLKPEADLNSDCAVNCTDLQIMADQWLGTGYLLTPTDPGMDGLVARYTFDGDSSDTSGNSHHGTPDGDPTYAAGKFDQAIRLDGVDDYVVVGAVGISGPDPRTICGWAKATSTDIPAWTTVFGFSNDLLSDQAGTYFDIQRRNYSAYAIHIYGWERDLTAVDLNWHHLAASYDGTTISWYADGALVGSEGRTLNTLDNIMTGKRGDRENYFPGLVDDVYVYNRALSDAEIAWLAGRTEAFSEPFDLDVDGTVNFADYAILLNSWLDELLWPQP